MNAQGHAALSLIYSAYLYTAQAQTPSKQTYKAKCNYNAIYTFTIQHNKKTNEFNTLKKQNTNASQ